VKKNDDKVLPVRKHWMQYFSTLAADYLTIVFPVLLVFTVSTPSLYFHFCLDASISELKGIKELIEKQEYRARAKHFLVIPK
jgi:hypothetical protein